MNMPISHIAILSDFGMKIPMESYYIKSQTNFRASHSITILATVAAYLQEEQAAIAARRDALNRQMREDLAVQEAVLSSRMR